VVGRIAQERHLPGAIAKTDKGSQADSLMSGYRQAKAEISESGAAVRLRPKVFDADPMECKSIDRF
jgi:hypothetical protein